MSPACAGTDAHAHAPTVAHTYGHWQPRVRTCRFTRAHTSTGRMRRTGNFRPKVSEMCLSRCVRVSVRARVQTPTTSWPSCLAHPQ
eukprot:6197289-Pleurochrysis_carterae.AAC.1